MGQQADLLGTVENIYAAALDGARWPGVLTAVADLVGGVDTTLEVHGKTGAAPLFFAAGGRLPALGIEDYLSHYAPICPRIPYLATQKTGSVGCDYEFISEQEMDRDEFYADFLAPDDLRYFASGILANKPGVLGGVYVHRSPRQGPAETEDLATLAQLVPHVSQALDLHFRLEKHSGQTTHFNTLIEHLPQAVITLDGQGRLQFVNSAAEVILRNQDGLSQHNGQLQCSDHEANAEIGKTLAGLLAHDVRDSRAVHGQIVVRRPSGRAAYVLAIHRLAGIRTLFDGVLSPAAAVFIYDPDQAIRVRAAPLAQAFALTPRETELALALLRGGSLQAFAAGRGVKISTARSHLKSLMRKTDTRSQAGLVRLLTGFSATIP